jgi:hypothetical protein
MMSRTKKIILLIAAATIIIGTIKVVLVGNAYLSPGTRDTKQPLDSNFKG